MKILQRIMVLALILLCCGGLLVLPATATFVEHEGLEISIEMDKEEYLEGEPITATITVTNVSAESITIVNLEQLIPEGYKLTEGSDVAMKDVEMHPGRILVLKVTFEGDPTQETETAEEVTGFEAFVNQVLYGKTMGVPNMLIATILGIAIVIFFILT